MTRYELLIGKLTVWFGDTWRTGSQTFLLSENISMMGGEKTENVSMMGGERNKQDNT